MPINQIVHPDTGQVLRFGRTRPIAHGPRFRLTHYLDMSQLPEPPASVDYSVKAMDSLRNVYLNDELGDCCIAGIGHLAGVFTGNVDPTGPVVFSDDQIKRLYSAIGGYVDGDESTDNGCNENIALSYWQQHGLEPDGSYSIAGSLIVDSTNKAEVMAAQWLFESLYFGVELPNEWLKPFPSKDGFIWDVTPSGPNPDQGHCFVGVGYHDKGILIDTWGLIGTITWQAVAEYANPKVYGELHTVLSHDAIDKASEKAPNGFAWQDLQSDFKKFLG